MRIQILLTSVLTFLFSPSLHAFGPSVQFASGKAQGQTQEGVESFLGIPYAAPPIGVNRWKAPRPVQSWSGTLKADHFSDACPQRGNFFANVPAEQFGQFVGNEDCLYLNLWRPSDIREQGKKLPVVFWIHGGSNFKGTSSDPMYDGTYVAKRSNVVFISVNYRLGMLGAFASDAFAEENKLDRSGNYVTLDLIQALKWVRDNVEQFGGDPANVTIMGQSAGCMNVWGLLQSPLSKDLYHKAVCSSGLPNAYPQIFAKARGLKFIENLVIQAGLVEDESKAEALVKNKDKKWLKEFLYSRTAEELVMAQDYTIPIQHIVDGEVIPHGFEALALGNYQQVPIILGSTLDDGTYLIGGEYLKPSAVELWGWMQAPETAPKSPQDFVTIDFDHFQTMTKAGSIAIQTTVHNIYLNSKLHNSNSYLYSFEWKETPSPWKDVFGAVHGLDAVFYLGNFDTVHPNFARFAWCEDNRESRENLREKMSTYFTKFFYTGDPGWTSPITFK
ncbi:carboxylesterase/lipase family protein [Bdellovibrio sp. NC01]|uniref:carboxylesterase/lipase family protein n=1 Tax=Bdellovibrio sp. NC01 TaxID=2220073 RepID=UPI00115BFC95|nr:carboxylesterase family protein [Bdellovibrio sp. NC01]QDK38762.1 hypothetical protein DOE51_14795 [Bdellovibrio sp. NC01]